MISKDLTVTITNPTEGITLTLKTVSALGPGKVSIMADAGVYDTEELEDALVAIADFVGKQELKKPMMLTIGDKEPHVF
jgi:hypothetical protein